MEAKPRTSRVAVAHKEIYLDDTLTGLHEVGIPCDQNPPRKLKAEEFPEDWEIREWTYLSQKQCLAAEWEVSRLRNAEQRCNCGLL